MSNVMRIRSTLDARIRELLPAVEYRRMDHPEDREAVRKMVVDGYRHSFNAVDDWQGFKSDGPESFPNVHTLGIFIRNKLVSTIRITVVTREIQNSWSAGKFSEILQPKFESGAVMIEVNRLAVDPKASLQIPELPFLTFRVVAMACVHYEADECFSIIRDKHVGLYKRLFNGVVVGEPYYFVPFKCEARLVISPMNVIRDKLNFRFESFGSTYLERRQLFGRADLIPGFSPAPLKVA